MQLLITAIFIKTKTVTKSKIGSVEILRLLIKKTDFYFTYIQFLELIINLRLLLYVYMKTEIGKSKVDERDLFPGAHKRIDSIFLYTKKKWVLD